MNSGSAARWETGSPPPHLHEVVKHFLWCDTNNPHDVIRHSLII